MMCQTFSLVLSYAFGFRKKVGFAAFSFKTENNKDFTVNNIIIINIIIFIYQ